MTQTLLVILVFAVAIATGVTASRLQQLDEKIGYLGQLLAAEFNKEKNYHERAKYLDEQFSEMLKETHGLGPVEAVPMPPEPPAIVLGAEMLRSINGQMGHLRRLAEAVEKLAAQHEVGSGLSDKA